MQYKLHIVYIILNISNIFNISYNYEYTLEYHKLHIES